jgi:hypothetical protein
MAVDEIGLHHGYHDSSGFDELIARPVKKDVTRGLQAGQLRAAVAQKPWDLPGLLAKNADYG